MITGFNTDIEHKGTVYHVQTEDKGLENPLVLSLVYVGGEILASKRAPYHDLIEEGFDKAILQERLNRQHKLICAAIKSGRIEDLKRINNRAENNSAPEKTAPSSVEQAPPENPLKPNEAAQTLSASTLTSAEIAPAQAETILPNTLEIESKKSLHESAAAENLLEINYFSPDQTLLKDDETQIFNELDSEIDMKISAPESAAGVETKTPENSTHKITFEILGEISTNSGLKNSAKITGISANKSFDVPNSARENFSKDRSNENSKNEAEDVVDVPVQVVRKSSSIVYLSENVTQRRRNNPFLSKSAAPAPLKNTSKSVPAKSEGDISIRLGGEQEFRSGKTYHMQIAVSDSASNEALSGAVLILKILGSAFRPIVQHLRTNANGFAETDIEIPRFRTGRAAILIKAEHGGKEGELRRIVTQI